MTASDQDFPVSGIRGAILKFALIGLAVIAVGAFLTWFFTCPCGRIPGGYLFGKVTEEPVKDWSFANQGFPVPDSDQHHTAPLHQPQLHGHPPRQPLPQLFKL